MMTPLRRITAGGDQEKFTCLCPATAANISGTPVGTGVMYYCNIVVWVFKGTAMGVQYLCTTLSYSLHHSEVLQLCTRLLFWYCVIYTVDVWSKTIVQVSLYGLYSAVLPSCFILPLALPSRKC